VISNQSPVIGCGPKSEPRYLVSYNGRNGKKGTDGDGAERPVNSQPGRVRYIAHDSVSCATAVFAAEEHARDRVVRSAALAGLSAEGRDEKDNRDERDCDSAGGARETEKAPRRGPSPQLSPSSHRKK
jgi:hypothetical protein